MTYSYLLTAHSIFRWLVLLSLFFTIFRSFQGWRSGRDFTKIDDAARHWTATIAHIQLVLGILLYSQSPIIKYFWTNIKVAKHNLDSTFFGLIHIILMLIVIILITIGSALAKRKSIDNEKFKTMLNWFIIALIILFIAIPWPFSPLANRPYFR